jgi:hypothetical protein
MLDVCNVLIKTIIFMKSIIKPFSRNVTTQDIPSQTSTLDKLLNLKYTPYTKMIHHTDEDKYYLVVGFLSGRGSEIFSTSNSIKNNKLYIDIEVYTGNADESEYTLSQIIFNTKEDLKNVSDVIRNGINIDYVVTISHGNKTNKENNLIYQGSNPGGGTTNPQDPYPPAK